MKPRLGFFVQGSASKSHGDSGSHVNAELLPGAGHAPLVTLKFRSGTQPGI